MFRPGHRAFDHNGRNIVMCQFQSENCTYCPGSHHEYLGTQRWRSQEAHPPVADTVTTASRAMFGDGGDYHITRLRY
jgi:hypothetical protein